MQLQRAESQFNGCFVEPKYNCSVGESQLNLSYIGINTIVAWGNPNSMAAWRSINAMQRRGIPIHNRNTMADCENPIQYNCSSREFRYNGCLEES